MTGFGFKKLDCKISNTRIYFCLGLGLCIFTVGCMALILRYGSSMNYIRTIKSDAFKEPIDEEDQFYGNAKDFRELGMQRDRYELDFDESDLKPRKKYKVHVPPTVKAKNYMDKIIYNRVGKCGSRSMLTLIARLAKMNDYLLYSSPISNRSRASLPELIREVQIINDLPTPVIYSRHIHYVDLFRFGVSGAVYINMIRDPIERFSSQYHFLRYGDGNKAVGRHHEPWEEGEKDMNINDCILLNHPLCSAERIFYVVPYFCGQDIMCQRPSKESLYRAKVHVLENYLVVGYLEDFTGMLQVLEKTLPSFFTNSLKLWQKVSSEAVSNTSTLKKDRINSTAYYVLKERMKAEYDFYNFVKLRFKVLKRQMGIFDDSDENS